MRPGGYVFLLPSVYLFTSLSISLSFSPSDVATVSFVMPSLRFVCLKVLSRGTLESPGTSMFLGILYSILNTTHVWRCTVKSLNSCTDEEPQIWVTIIFSCTSQPRLVLRIASAVLCGVKNFRGIRESRFRPRHRHPTLSPPQRLIFPRGFISN